MFPGLSLTTVSEIFCEIRREGNRVKNLGKFTFIEFVSNTISKDASKFSGISYKWSDTDTIFPHISEDIVIDSRIYEWGSRMLPSCCYRSISVISSLSTHIRKCPSTHGDSFEHLRESIIDDGSIFIAHFELIHSVRAYEISFTFEIATDKSGSTVPVSSTIGIIKQSHMVDSS